MPGTSGSRPSSMHRLLAELKRRGVLRMAAVYGGVGFGMLQVVELVVPALLLPEWTYRFITVLVLAGFPIAIALAWSIERAPEGLRLTRPAQAGELEAIVEQPRTRRWASGLLAVLGTALLTSAAWWTLTRASGHPVPE